MWIANAFNHACWCSSATSLHPRDLAIFDAILAPSYNTLSSPHSGGSMVKMISLIDDDEEPVRKVFMKS